MTAAAAHGLLAPTNKLRLGTFGTNVEGGPALTTIPTRLRTEWSQVRALAITADRMGLDAIVPVARWRGHGGAHNTHGSTFDTFTWAAGVGAVTQRAQVFSTCHMPAVHPVVAAKQLATIDHITGGRAGVNTVGGWLRPELEMFGAPMLEHDRRYDLADEWTRILRSLWAEDEFDFDGDFFTIRRGFSEPKPVGRPPIMNAGGSERGRLYAARYADMAFVLLTGDDLASQREQVQSLKRLARDEFDRDIQVWTSAYLVCRDTVAEAERYLSWYADEHGDVEAADSALRTMSVESEVLGAQRWQQVRRGFIAGAGGVPLVGTPEMITARLAELSGIGIDGCLLVCAEWEPELDRLDRTVLPLLEQAGLRAPR
ncbi:LLM class flavin-dependent oxidoreductase [Nocardia suismassiliense]|uniref:LLM class flavin-dependent oxidoreductase n=1 Tax=Nocardia suismassiliense TaxID=2077092 RepID=UPI00131F3970|nr:LLM class flavin-dependent oxidoreductase [Nocardia suismassiliense]